MLFKKEPWSAKGVNLTSRTAGGASSAVGLPEGFPLIQVNDDSDRVVWRGTCRLVGGRKRWENINQFWRSKEVQGRKSEVVPDRGPMSAGAAPGCRPDGHSAGMG